MPSGSTSSRSSPACGTISVACRPTAICQRRYLATLDKQETELEAIAKRRGDAEKAVQAARDTLASYVTQLG
jgi:hypothetical protein